ncbi:hypothetical protein [Clostridium sp.]|nr:hypothetical protein [Clostridium sp.]
MFIVFLFKKDIDIEVIRVFKYSDIKGSEWEKRIYNIERARRK